MEKILNEINQCKICESQLVNGCRPVATAHPESKIILIGQAPGLAVHLSGIPWDDKSGANLRNWMGIDKDKFYDTQKIAIIPMGFCYPGKGKTGDLPPRKECAPQWHNQLINQINNPELIILVGKYAQDYYLGGAAEKNLTETVRNFKVYLPKYFVLPHPSPRNNIWKAKHEWFERDVLPEFKAIISTLI